VTSAAAMRSIRPQPGPQEHFLASPADVAIYGGAAGGGKTFALLMEALRHIDRPQFGAVIFRRTYTQITNEGGLWDASMALYPDMGGRPLLDDLSWRFPAGPRVSFAHMQHGSTFLNYQGAQIALLGFDELTTFTAAQFWYMFSRNRSTSGIRPYIRATCNPDAESWVAALIAWWIDQDTGFPIPERAGALRYFVRVNGELVWADDPAALMGYQTEEQPKSLTFIPARLSDNQILMRADPGYLANLLALPPLDRERLLDGNWKVRAAAGKLFNRAWFPIVDAAPDGGEECRFWDFAATEKKLRGSNPAFTAGIKIRMVDGAFYVTGCRTAQAGPADVDALLDDTTREDVAQAKQTGTRYRARWEIEPGSASIRENYRLVQKLAGIDAAGVPAHGDKVSRARGLAAQARVGNVRLVRGAWNEEWLAHMHAQPDLRHKDIMDGSSGSFNELAAGTGGDFSGAQAALAQAEERLAETRHRDDARPDRPLVRQLEW
jgi:predicted phage terminase large subunit-like protein